MAITEHETLKLQLSTQDAVMMLGGLWSGDVTVTGRNFTLCRQFCGWNGFFAIHSFFIKADKTLWNSHSVFVLLR